MANASRPIHMIRIPNFTLPPFKTRETLHRTQIARAWSYCPGTRSGRWRLSGTGHRRQPGLTTKLACVARLDVCDLQYLLSFVQRWQEPRVGRVLHRSASLDRVRGGDARALAEDHEDGLRSNSRKRQVPSRTDTLRPRKRRLLLVYVDRPPQPLLLVLPVSSLVRLRVPRRHLRPDGVTP